MIDDQACCGLCHRFAIHTPSFTPHKAKITCCAAPAAVATMPLRSLRAPAFTSAIAAPPAPTAAPRAGIASILCVSAPRCSLLRPRPPLFTRPPAPPRRWLCSPPRDPYTVLNVKRDATAAEIKAAYFKGSATTPT